MRRTTVRAVLAILTLITGGCAAGPTPLPAATASPTPTAGQIELTVLAASSLSDAFRELATAYEIGHPDVRIALSFDATSALRAKVASGLVADVFVAADATTPATLLAAELARGRTVTFAANTLALIVPSANPALIADAYDLERAGVRIVAAAADVPLSRYVAMVIANLQAYRGAQAEFPRIYATNVVSREDNVRAVLAKIELGEGDAAFVYATDAAASARVTTIPLPDETNVVTPYAAIALSAGSHVAAADAFVAWLSSDEAQDLLADRGFLPAPVP